MNTVYWIHYPNHTDPTVEGYIGITNNIERRIQDHKRTFQQYFDAGAIVTVLHEVKKREDAMVIEADYRPLPNIGWNTHPGSLKRLNSKPAVSTTGNSSTKMVNMRIDPDLWYRFKHHCKQEGFKSMSSRIQELMHNDMEGFVCHHQYDLFK